MRVFQYSIRDAVCTKVESQPKQDKFSFNTLLEMRRIVNTLGRNAEKASFNTLLEMQIDLPRDHVIDDIVLLSILY